MYPIRILLVDDAPVVLAGVRLALQHSRELKVVGEALDAPSAIQKALELHPGIVILDIAMQTMQGLHALREIRRQRPETRIVVFSAHGSSEWVKRAFEAGAAGFITKTQDLTDLGAILRSIHRGERYLSPSLVDVAVAEFTNSHAPPGAAHLLTPREARVLELLVEDKSSKEIAGFLGISPRTVDTHRANIMHKLNIHTYSGLVRYVLQRERGGSE
jgi:two-component system response regulator NreC